MEQYFTNEHFKLLNKWKNQKRDDSNPEQNRAYEELKVAYEVTEEWANLVQQRLFPEGNVQIRKRPTNQGNHFAPYNWAKIYPTKDAPQTLAYTVGIGAEQGFVVKIDTVGLTDDQAIRRTYLDFRGDNDKNCGFVAIKPAQEGLLLTLEELVDWSIDAIKQFYPGYEELANKLGISAYWNNDAIRENHPMLEGEEYQPYGFDTLFEEGCFLTQEEIERLLNRLKQKKNIVLQGPPGTGKTWLAKRLAYLLMGKRDDSKLRAVQFHPNLSYEDFVRGWRPSGEGKLVLANGVFMEAVQAAKRQPDKPYVVVIEEINRGNPAQVFGELLTLLEAGKRSVQDALELCYPDPDGIKRPVYLPENLFVIGTMNIADRSLALVDLALRRRFAFFDLEPRLGEQWLRWVIVEKGLDSEIASFVQGKMQKLNETIANEPSLGKQFQIGHSYVTPAYSLSAGESSKWFAEVVETEIGPLLDEYWFDASDQAEKAKSALLDGLGNDD